METSTEIIEVLRKGEVVPPGKLAEYRLRLSAEYGYISDQLAKILQGKASSWLEIRQRPETESDKMADKIWETMPQGQQEIGIKFTLKGLEKVISSLSSRLRAYENEQRFNS